MSRSSKSRSKSRTKKAPSPPKGMDALTQAMNRGFNIGAGVTAGGAKKRRTSTRVRKQPVRLPAAPAARRTTTKTKAGKSQLAKCEDELAKLKKAKNGMVEFLKAAKLWEDYKSVARQKGKVADRKYTEYGEELGAQVWPRRVHPGMWEDGKVRFGTVIYR